MPKRSSKKKQDLNERAFSIVQQLTESDSPGPSEEMPLEESGKNPAAVALGRLGGRKGGKARASSLSPEKRSEIAKKAASARWAKPQ